jgi:hypothetical protein
LDTGFSWVDEGQWPEVEEGELTHNYSRGHALRIFILRHPPKQISTSPARLRSRLRESMVVSLLLGGKAPSASIDQPLNRYSVRSALRMNS